MERRTVLKRLGAASVGAATTAGLGSASVERRAVEVDGQTYLVRTDVDVSALELSGDEEELVDGCCPGCDPKCFACCQQEEA